MLIELGILVLFILFCLTIFTALLYFGIFEELLISVGSPPYQFSGRSIAYKKERGKYSDSSALFTEICSLVPKLNTIGIYLDEPKGLKNMNKCRYIVGALLNEHNNQFEAQKQLLISKGFVCGQLPDVDHVVYTVFPFKGILSVVIAIRRVYPKIKSYIVEHNLCARPAIEVYSSDEIFFMFPLAKQDQFYDLYGSDDYNDNSGDEDDGDVEEEVVDEDNNANNGVQQVSTLPLNQLKGSKHSSHSSTSSSFEELLAEDN